MSRELPWLGEILNQLDADGLLRRRRQTRWLPNGFCEIDGRRVCNFIANDYLNLASDPRVIAAAEQALRETGVGARASALLGGRSDWHARLEKRLAEFEGEDAAILFPTGMAANLGTVAALIGEGDAVFCDRFNHASLVDGCRLSGARLRVYRHDDLETLERELTKPGLGSDQPGFQRNRSESPLTLTLSPETGERGPDKNAAAEARGRNQREQRKWIVTDGVFSMDGDLAPLRELCNLAERHRAEVIVDEAHGTGVFGKHGRGVTEHFGVQDRVAVRTGTLSKAVGALGGFVAGPQPLIDYLWNSARSQVYSTALPPAVCAAAEQAVAILQQEPERMVQLHQRATFLRQRFAENDVAALAGSVGPIIPIVLSDPRRAVEVSQRLEARGFLVGVIRPPTVPRGSSRLRISISTAHSEDRLAGLAIAVADELRRP